MKKKERASCFILFALFFLLLEVMGSCKRGDFTSNESPADKSSGPASLTASPMSLSDFLFATPLGNLNPLGHTLPSDHAYFYWVDPDHRTPNDMAQTRPVLAPGDGMGISFTVLQPQAAK